MAISLTLSFRATRSARSGATRHAGNSAARHTVANAKDATVRTPAAHPGRRHAGIAALLLHHTGVTATLLMLAALLGLQALALLRAPAAWLPAAISVKLAPGENIILGQHELAAPQSDRNHLALRRDMDGSWWLRNLSSSRQVVLLRDGGEQRMNNLPLQTGQRFQIDYALFDIVSADADSVNFARDGHQWRYDGAVLYRDGHQQANCPDAHLAAKTLSLWNRAMPQWLTISRPLSFGGNLHCDNRLGLAQVTPGAAQLARNNGRLQLAAGNPDGDRAAVLVQTPADNTGPHIVNRQELPAADQTSLNSSNSTDLRKQESALADVNAIIVGHTRFQLNATGDQLTMQPSRHIKLFQAPELKLSDHVSWQWQQRALWNNAHDKSIWIMLAACLVFAAAGARHAAGNWLATAMLFISGAAALLAQRAGYPPSASCSLLLAACTLLLWIALPGRLTLLAAASVILLAAGLLAQLELGLGAPESSWLRYYQKSAAMLAVGCGLGGMARLWMRQQAGRAIQISQRSIEWLLALFAAVALAALAAEVLWGDETGVFDLQPVELAKLALTALTAHGLALRFGWNAGPLRLAEHGARWLQLIAPALLFLALMGVSLVQVDDFSPLILLLVWTTCVAFAYALVARNRRLAAAVGFLALSAAAAIIYLRCVGTDDLIRWGFYADRFLVWLNPAEHPHTGQQLLLGARAIAEGGWLGSDHWLGLRSLGQAAGSAVQIPAVQDDFAASFFLNRHGLAGGLLLWLAQAAFLTGLVLTAWRAYADSKRTRHFRQAWAARFRYFLLCGGGAFALGHFLLSWGTNLAIFPIMGQPMSFLSAGGSHWLFFLCPLLTIAAVSAQSSEENESCRSTSNTKS